MCRSGVASSFNKYTTSRSPQRTYPCSTGDCSTSSVGEIIRLPSSSSSASLLSAAPEEGTTAAPEVSYGRQRSSSRMESA